MLYSVPLQISQKLVEFERESDLEELLWQNLDHLNNLIPLAQQHYVGGQYCDILAIDANKRLHIIELKIYEDRYVIQQLTRYYDALIKEKSFQDKIDYSQPIKLIAILPTIHRDNLIDIKYSRLNFDLLTYKISICYSNQFYLSFQNLSGHNIGKIISSSYTQNSDRDEHKQPSSSFLKLLILSYSSKIKEFITGSAKSAIAYGVSKTKLISEFRFDKSRNEIVLFLWLPHHRLSKRMINRFRIWTDWNVITALGYMRKGIGKMISYDEFQKFHHSQFPVKLRPKDIKRFETDIEYRNSWIKNQSYYRFVTKHGNPLAMDPDFYLRRLINPQFPDPKKSPLNLSNYDIQPEHYSKYNAIYPPLASFIKFATASRIEGLV